MRKIFIPKKSGNTILVNELNKRPKVIIKRDNTTIGFIITTNNSDGTLYSIMGFTGKSIRNGEDTHYESIQELMELNAAFEYYLLEE